MLMAKQTFVHQDTGEIISVVASQAPFLHPNYKKVTHLKNAKGEPMLRLPLRNAIVDVTEVEQKAAPDVNASAE